MNEPVKKIMIIAGGDWQVPIIQKAKDMGLFVINTNLYEDSPGFRYADVGVVADVLDKERNLEIARVYAPDAVITDQTDIAVPTVAYLCEQLGLPGIGMEKAGLFTNKHLMRKFLEERRFPTPRFCLCRGLDEAVSFCGENGFPAVVKPPASQSSRGVHKISSMDDLAELYRDALRFSHDGSVLMEEYIEGTEFTVEGFATHARAYSLAVSRKTHFPHSEMVASRLHYSLNDPEYDYEELRALNERLVSEMGLPFGITHAEYKFKDGRYYLIEIAARGGGTKISSHVVPEMSGIDVNELLIRCAMGERIREIWPERRDVHVVLDLLLFSAGRVDSIEGVDMVLSDPRVIDFGVNFKPGDEIREPADDRSRHAHLIARGKSRSEIDEICRKVRDTIRVTYRKQSYDKFGKGA